MYYLNSSFYNPFIGRFINSDGLLSEQGNVLGHNMYAYTQNNPVMYIDPEGESILLAYIAVTFAVAIFTLVVCGEPEEKPLENISLSGSANPMPSGGGGNLYGPEDLSDNLPVYDSFNDPGIQPTLSYTDGFSYDESGTIGGESDLYYFFPLGDGPITTDTCASYGPNYLRWDYKYVSVIPNNYYGLTNRVKNLNSSYNDYSKDFHYEPYSTDESKVYQILDKCRGYEIVEKEWEIDANYIFKTYYSGNYDVYDYYIPISLIGTQLQTMKDNITTADKIAINDAIAVIGLGGGFGLDAALANISATASHAFFPAMAALSFYDYIMDGMQANEIANLDNLIDAANDLTDVLHIRQSCDDIIICAPLFSSYEVIAINSVPLYNQQEDGFNYRVDVEAFTIENVENMLTEARSQSVIDIFINIFS